jgi:outer membrane protein TolC
MNFLFDKKNTKYRAKPQRRKESAQLDLGRKNNLHLVFRCAVAAWRDNFFYRILKSPSNLSLIYAIAAFVILLQVVAHARVLTYEDAINIALKESYTIKSFEQNKEAMEWAYTFSKAEFKPRLDIAVYAPSWTESVIPVQQANGLPVYNSFGSMQMGGELAFTYMLPTGGNLALSSQLYRDNLNTSLASQNYRTLSTNKAYSRLAVSFNQPIFTKNEKKENLIEARHYYDRSTSRFTRGQMDIIYEVTRGFYTVYRTTREVEIAQEKLANAEEAYRIAEIKAQNGRIPEVDVLITKVDLARSQALVSESKNNLEREKDSFKQLIGLSLEEEIEIVTDLKYASFVVQMDKAIQSALAHRLELNEAKLNIELQKIQLDRAERYSELKGNISAYYDVTGLSTIESASSRDLFESSFDNFVDRRPNRGVTFSISYPIFDWGRGSAMEQSQKARLNDYELDLDNTRKEIIREVRDVVRSVEEAKNRLSIHEQNQQVSQMTYEISRKRFENGDINSQELALEQERLADSQLAYLDAFITYQLHVADLKRTTLWDFEGGKSYLEEIEN